MRNDLLLVQGTGNPNPWLGRRWCRPTMNSMVDGVMGDVFFALILSFCFFGDLEIVLLKYVGGML